MLNIQEIFDIIVMTVFIGFIFKDVFRKPAALHYDPISQVKGMDWSSFWFSASIVAPAIIFHEFAHKFVGLYFGLQSTFHAAYFWLFLGLVLKMMNFGFIFFVPAYVTSVGTATHIQFAMLSLAGPLMNLLLWITSASVLKFVKLKHKYIPYLALTSKINMFLFFFNMIPIRPFDGGGFFYHLWQAFA